MEKIQSFTVWLEAIAAPLTGYDPNQTQAYVPSGNFSTSGVIGSTGNNAGDKTGDYRPVGHSNVVDPEIVQSAQGLQDIHNKLRNIFAKAREKARAFRYPSMKSAFDRELMAGIDGVGRAHSIILPTARGTDED